MFTRKWKLQIGFPLYNKAEGRGNIKAGFLPGGRFVKTEHRGPYHKVGKTYKKMLAWIRENNLKIKGESIEIYNNDPRITKKEKLETTILIPISE